MAKLLKPVNHRPQKARPDPSAAISRKYRHTQFRSLFIDITEPLLFRARHSAKQAPYPYSSAIISGQFPNEAQAHAGSPRIDLLQHSRAISGSPSLFPSGFFFNTHRQMRRWPTKRKVAEGGGYSRHGSCFHATEFPRFHKVREDSKACASPIHSTCVLSLLPLFMSEFKSGSPFAGSHGRFWQRLHFEYFPGVIPDLYRIIAV